MKRPKLIILLLLVAFLAGCNEPPRYTQDAREFLRTQGISNDVIEKLATRQPLESDMAEQLARYENVAVLHLLGENPGTPQAIIDRLARHENFEVRTGVADNPNLSLDLLLALRTPGKYTTVNTVVARNPRLPQAIIWEMHRNGEASDHSFAMNTSSPPELMREIAAKGDTLAKGYLAQNPNIPEDVVQKLAQDKNEDTRMRLTFNPALPAQMVCWLHQDKSQLVRDHVEHRVEKEAYPLCDRSEPITDPIAYPGTAIVAARLFRRRGAQLFCRGNQTGETNMNWLGKFTEFAYALLRIAAGFMFAFHGVQKLFGVLTTFQPAIGSQLWFGGIIELAGGAAIMLGIRTRFAAFLCSGMMAVAYFQFHWKFQGGAAFFPTVNQGELAALYCFVFFFIACRGGKMWSLGKD